MICFKLGLEHDRQDEPVQPASHRAIPHRNRKRPGHNLIKHFSLLKPLSPGKPLAYFTCL
jgi:hypothetical protein